MVGGYCQELSGHEDESVTPLLQGEVCVEEACSAQGARMAQHLKRQTDTSMGPGRMIGGS